MIFNMPRIDQETEEDALKRVDREIENQTERENFHKVITAMYSQSTQTPAITEGGE